MLFELAAAPISQQHDETAQRPVAVIGTGFKKRRKGMHDT